MPDKKQDLKKLKKTIDKGMWLYVFRTGGLWGVLMFLFFTVWDLIDSQSFEDFQFSVGLNLFVWSIGGLVFGLAMWWFVNRKYNQLIK